MDDESIIRVEQEIDRLDEALPELSSFILPGGSQSGALCHICRTIARRTERRLFDMNEIHSVDSHILIFINRLSDYFFALSRFLTLSSDCEEIYWKTQD